MENPLVDRDTQDFNTTLDYSINPESSPLLDARATLYYNHTKMDENRVTKNQQDTTRIKTLGPALGITLRSGGRLALRDGLVSG
ncbi:hypothetical protein [Dongshaea marina]|uniref:hypothetical protein n=1 Tax=Dongshaea marina TaxID=2047966 RepID=UPI000D3EBBD1|nr:hypothetical protein [Dongshaea marina]